MCTFEFTVLLCGCEAVDCKQRSTHYIDKYLPENGHVLRITQARRTSGMCINWFNNTNPDRMLVRWGFPADNRNSTQDCMGDKKYAYNQVRERTKFCDACLRTCEQPRKIAMLVNNRCESAKVERQKRGLEKRPEEGPSEELLEALDEDEAQRIMQYRLKKGC